MIADHDVTLLVLLLALSGLFLALGIAAGVAETLTKLWEKYRAQR